MQKLTLRNYIGYAAGDAANNLSFSMVTTFLTLYYTDVLGAEAAAIATLIFVVRFWDALADLFAGQLVDRTQTRWGKFRPYFLFGSVPLLLSSVLCFSVPSSLTLGQKMVWAYVSYALMGVLYSLVNIPYGSLAAAMTQDSVERAKLASFRTVGSFSTILLISFVVSPQVQSNRGNPDGLQTALTTITLVFLVLGIVLYGLLYFNAKEQVQRDVASVSLRKSLPVLAKNRPLIMLCLSSLLFLTAMFMTQALGIYFARDVLGDANYFKWLSLLSVLGTFLVVALAPTVVRTLGKKRGYVVFGAVALVGGVLVYVLPTTPFVFPAIGWFVMNMGIGGVNMLMWALEADTVEYGEWKSGVRTEGITYATFSFTRKMGQAIGGSIGVSMLGFFGYVANRPGGQVAETVNGIKVGVGLVPAGIIVVACLIMLAYPLTEARFAAMLEEMRSRRERTGQAGPTQESDSAVLPNP